METKLSYWGTYFNGSATIMSILHRSPFPIPQLGLNAAGRTTDHAWMNEGAIPSKWRKWLHHAAHSSWWIGFHVWSVNDIHIFVSDSFLPKLKTASEVFVTNVVFRQPHLSHDLLTGHRVWMRISWVVGPVGDVKQFSTFYQFVANVKDSLSPTLHVSSILICPHPPLPRHFPKRGFGCIKSDVLWAH